MTKSFDSEVKVGELRIFADLERPVVALIAEDRGAFGFRIIPVSDFTSVSCEGEQLVGERVYQYWNACNVPLSFASRSWLVATLSPEELESVRSQPFISASTSSLHLTPYQRTYLFSVPSPFASFENESSHRTFSSFTFTFPFRRVAGFALAACLVFALVFAVRLDLDRASHKEERAHAWNLVLAPSELEKLQEVSDGPAESDQVEVAANAPKFVIAPPDAVKLEREPEIGGEVSAPKIAKVKEKSDAPLDRVDAARMRLLKRNTAEEHAIAVMTYIACGVSAGESEFGPKLVESSEKLVAEVKSGKMTDEYVRRLVATALCRAYVAIANPDLKSPAEFALDSLGDKRAVEIVARGYDLIEDWYESRREYVSGTSGTVAVPIAWPDWFRFLKSRVK